MCVATTCQDISRFAEHYFVIYDSLQMKTDILYK